MNTMNMRDEPPDLSAVEITVAVCVNDVSVELNDRSPTGEQILAAARLRPAADYALIHWPKRGPTNEIALHDVIHLPLRGEPEMFYAAEADGIRYFTLDEERYAWAGSLDTDTVRRIGRIDDGMQLWLERTDEDDRLLMTGEVIDLKVAGVERIYTKKATWKLRVQNKEYEFDQPQVSVREALTRAGYDVSKAWEVKFKVAGQAIRPVGIDDVLDLSQPGVERLRVGPGNVHNGDSPVMGRRDFSLLAEDTNFLTDTARHWQSVVTEGHRWLIVEDYPLPPGYNMPSCTIAVEMPEAYPSAQLDMFFCYPHLTVDGVAPQQTEHRQAIDGKEFQRWSRHRGPGSEWTPGTDNLESHFALIDHALAREVGA